MDRLAAMRMLLAVVEEGSFTSASRKLGVPLPTLSRRVGELESFLETKLLNRSTRMLTPTDAGRAYFDACRGILEQIEAAESAVTSEYVVPRGKLKITAPPCLGRLHILPIVLTFLAEHPEIDVKLVFTDHSRGPGEDGVEIAVRIGELPDTSLVATRIGEYPFVVCASPAYFDSRGMPNKPEDVSGHDCITWNTLEKQWDFEGAAPVVVRARLTVDSADAAVEAAISGFGVTRVLSLQIESAIRSGMLKRALQNYESKPLPVSLVYMPRKSLPAKVRTFLDWSIPRLRTRLRQDERTSSSPLGQNSIHMARAARLTADHSFDHGDLAPRPNFSDLGTSSSSISAAATRERITSCNESSRRTASPASVSEFQSEPA